MALRNTTERYGSVTKWIHWIIFVLVTFMLLSGFLRELVPSKASQQTIMQLHKSTGILIFVLMALRIAWTLSNPKPDLPASIARWQRAASRFVQGLLYITLLSIPLTGWIFSTSAGHPPIFYGLFTVAAPVAKNPALTHWFHEAHNILGWTVLTLVSVHVLAALKHHFVDKNDVLKQMLPGRWT